MKLRALRLWNVRRFGNRGTAIEGIGDGVNVLAAENEHGKSTSFDALHALLFQPHSSTRTEVRLLRPYSGGNPRIEADIETSDGLFQVAKQYYGGGRATVTDIDSGSLVAQADEAETWISRLVSGGKEGPAGLLWVRQGATDLESTVTAQRNAEQKAREGVLSSVTGEVEALTGGRRMARIMERCEAELEPLVTSGGRPKAGGPYKVALDELEVLNAREQDLAGQVEALRTALDQRGAKAARLEELKNPEATKERQDRNEIAQVALQQAEQHAGRHSQAMREKTVETERYSTAADRLKRYRDALTRATDLAPVLKEKQTELSQAESEQAAASRVEQQSAKGLSAAEEGLGAADGVLRQAQAAKSSRDAETELAVQEGALGKAIARQEEIADLQAARDDLVLPEGTIGRLEILHREIAALEAALEAASVTVSIRYSEGREGSVSTGGLPLPGDETSVVAASTVFEIDGTGSFTVSPGIRKDGGTATDLDAKKRGLREILDELGLNDIGDARTRERQLPETDADLRVKRAELAALAPDGAEALRAEIARLRTLITDASQNVSDTEEAERSVESARERLNETRAARENALIRLTDVGTGLVQARSDFEKIQTELTALEETLGPAESRDVQLTRLVTADADAANRLAKATRDVASLEKNAPDLDSVRAVARRTASVVENVQSEIADLEKEVSELTGVITARSDDAVEESHAETLELKEAVEARVRAFGQEIAVLNRLKCALEEARGEAREQYFGPVMDELKPLLSLLFDEASITFDDNTLLPGSLERGGQKEDVGVLSGGMREQLAVLTRLAFARLLAKSGESVPVILDDALVYSDDDRIERMFDALHRQATDLQIIVFTCRQRAFERLGGQGLRMTDWNPDGVV